MQAAIRRRDKELPPDQAIPSAAVGDQDGSDEANDDPINNSHDQRKVLLLATQSRKKKKHQAPQDAIDEFWVKFNAKTPGPATKVLPNNPYTAKAGKTAALGAVQGEKAAASYEEAAKHCKAKVERIVLECRRINHKYRDPHFDIELDLKHYKRDCLRMLEANRTRPGRHHRCGNFYPESVKRVEDIFEEPKFFINGPKATDIRQGNDGDCWLLAALSTMANKPGLIEKLCVARDEKIGVYGFVFYRDGEWVSEVIDDKLYLTKPDFDESWWERYLIEDRIRINSEEDYRKFYQTGSGALYFAQCEDPNETWLPLLEKAFAKAHGDYASIDGGCTGEAVEDLTGGVTTELFSTDVLDREYFWREELLKTNEQFLFAASSAIFLGRGIRKGIYEGHAYSVLKAIEMDGERLICLRNPWGHDGWHGAWGDGSKEWTPEWMAKLEHKFGDDGVFWMNYSDFLKKFQTFERTRLFTDEWKVTQQWAKVLVPWTVDYHDTKFSFVLEKSAHVMIVLSQLDGRYFRGFEGQYRFEFTFRVHKEGEEENHVVRSHSGYMLDRSATAELELPQGTYQVLMKVEAIKLPHRLPVEDVVRNNAQKRRDKVLRVGLSHDLAQAKGQVAPKELKRLKDEAEKKVIADVRKEVKERLIKEKQRKKHAENKERRKARAMKHKRRARAKAKAERRKAKEAAENEAASTKDSEAKSDDKKVELKRDITEDPSSAFTVSVDNEPKHASDESATTAAADKQGSAAADDRSNTARAIISEYPMKTFIENNDEAAKASSSAKGLFLPRSETKAVAMARLSSAQSLMIACDESEKSNDASRPGPPMAARSQGPIGKGPSSSKRATRTGGSASSEQPETIEVEVQEDSSATPHPALTAINKPTNLLTSRSLTRPHVGLRAPFTIDISDDDTDYESDIESDISDVTDGDIDEAIEADAKLLAKKPDKSSAEKRQEEDEEEDEFQKDPWNAVVTLGLRVYSKDSPVSMTVIRPVAKDEETENALDVDDPAADAVVAIDHGAEKSDKTGLEPVEIGKDPAVNETEGAKESEGELTDCEKDPKPTETGEDPKAEIVEKAATHTDESTKSKPADVAQHLETQNIEKTAISTDESTDRRKDLKSTEIANDSKIEKAEIPGDESMDPKSELTTAELGKDSDAEKTEKAALPRDESALVFQKFMEIAMRMQEQVEKISVQVSNLEKKASNGEVKPADVDGSTDNEAKSQQDEKRSESEGSSMVIV